MDHTTRRWAGGMVAALLLATGFQGVVHNQGPRARPDAPRGGPLAPDKPIAKAHNDAAKALAEVDDNPLIRWAYNIWCVNGYRHAGPNDPVDALADPDDWVSPKGVMTEREPQPISGKFMDNAWYFGQQHNGVVVVKAPEGLLLFDTLSNPQQFETLILPQMKTFGLDPKDITHIFMGHQHGDHIGGANHIRANYAPGALFIMGGPDADGVATSRAAILRGEAVGRGGQAAGRLTPEQQQQRLMLFPDRIDIRVDATPGLKNGMREIKIGDSTTVVAALVPGHTVGQMAVIVPVTWQGRPHKLVVWSGNDQITQARQYSVSFDYFRAVAKTGGADAWINQHAYQGHVYQWVRKVNADPASRNPFIMGADGVDRFFGIMAECHKALDQRVVDGTWKAM